MQSRSRTQPVESLGFISWKPYDTPVKVARVRGHVSSLLSLATCQLFVIHVARNPVISQFANRTVDEVTFVSRFALESVGTLTGNRGCRVIVSPGTAAVLHRSWQSQVQDKRDLCIMESYSCTAQKLAVSGAR
jgi:hypothetical protein